MIVSSTLIALLGWKVLVILTRPWFSHFRHLPGLTSWNPLWGNQNDMRLLDVYVDPERWSNKYGQVLRYRGFFNVTIFELFSLVTFSSYELI